jgi:hypothetical protein
MKRVTFTIDKYIEPWTSLEHTVFNVFIEDMPVYSKDYGYSEKNIIDFIGDFIKEVDLGEIRSKTYTIRINGGDTTYSVTNMPTENYTSDDTL